jgi:hypothetical protein
MMPRTLLAIALPLAFFASAGAAGPALPEDCTPPTDNSAISIGGLYYLKPYALDGRYPPVRFTVWYETNGYPGLQPFEFGCPGHGMTTWPGDTYGFNSAQLLA